MAVVSGGRVVQRGLSPSLRFSSGRVGQRLAGSFSELITDSSGHLAQIMRLQVRRVPPEHFAPLVPDRSGELET